MRQIDTLKKVSTNKQNLKLKIFDYVKQPRIVQIVLFGIVGGLSTIADTLITTMSYRFTKDLALSVLLGYISSLLIGYILHKKVTFKSEHMNKSSLKRYAVAAVIAYFFSLFIVRAFMYTLRVDDAFVPKLFSIPFVALFSFLLGKFWVFREEPEYALK
ncbi:MAG: GtrA family protein [Methylococcaceae bacterium]